ncbi:MAG TPA: hypothetical protein VMY42_12770 [Thermoguttaceae bacterium]|nr:hypothetical protein [Thermoguttaceae bacterium]
MTVPIFNAIATFGDELLCLPEVHSRDNDSLMWQIDSTHLPEVGTKVTLRLRPQVKPALKTGKAEKHESVDSSEKRGQ